MPVFIRRLFGLFQLLGLLLTACAPLTGKQAALSVPQVQKWTPADLRLLDPIDSPSNEQDLIAAYMRQTGADLQIRLDLLDNADPLAYDLHIALDFLLGGHPLSPTDGNEGFGWDVLVNAPATRNPQISIREGLSLPPISPRVVRDSFLDCAVLSIPSQLFSGSRRITAWAWISLPDASEALDTLGPFQLEGALPPRAPVLLEFTDALPARTPVQLLRRWDGAHTGPYGQRHGIRYLLNAAQSNAVPITLLDLSQPESLRGLQRVGELARVRQMVNTGLLSLPDNGYALPEFAPEIAAYDRTVAAGMGLPVGKASYGYSFAGDLRQPDLVYTALRDSSHIQQVDAVRFIPSLTSLQPQDIELIDKDGLTTRALQMLLDTALSPDPSDLVLMGGRLSNSAWGDLTVVEKTLQYIAGHPWIQPLSIVDLVTFPALKKQPGSEIFACKEDPLCIGTGNPVSIVTPYGMPAANSIDSDGLTWLIYDSLTRLPADPFANSAREMFAALIQPVADSTLAKLDASALSQVGFLIEASRWNQNPISQAQCDADLDWDGFPECILSDQVFFNIIDPEGGRLAFAAVRTRNQANQWIGPTFQNAAGLNDSFTGSDRLNSLADTQEIPGAFADQGSDWSVYTAVPGENQIELRNAERGLNRSFSLRGGKMLIQIRADSSIQRIPIYLSALAESNLTQPFAVANSLQWPLAADVTAEIQFEGATIQGYASVLDVLPLLRQSEDPDRAYPAGHYLPFPFLILNLNIEKDFTATISIN